MIKYKPLVHNGLRQDIAYLNSHEASGGPGKRLRPPGTRSGAGKRLRPPGTRSGAGKRLRPPGTRSGPSSTPHEASGGPSSTP